MFGMLWLVLHALALVAEGGVSSGSGEVAGGNGGGNNNNNNNGGGGGGGGVVGINGVGIPQNNPTFQVLPVGGSFFIQPFGNVLAPQAPQGPVQQLVPFGPFQQGAGGFFLGQQGGANLIPQAQGRVVQASAGGGGGGVPLYAVLSQGGNLMGGPQGPMILSGQQLQLVPLNQQNQHQQNLQNQQNQQQPAVPVGGGNAAAGRTWVKRSVAARPRRTKVMAAMEATAKPMEATARPMGPEEEESSGLDTEERMTMN